MEQLSHRALNRALLARQMLLKRESLDVARVIEHLGGLQAQQARPPFTGLWSRIDGFTSEHLSNLLRARKVLRAMMLRGTLHLVTAADFQAWRPLLQPMLNAGAQGILRDRLTNFDHEKVLEFAGDRYKIGPRTFTSLRNELVAAFPDGDERAMGYFVRMNLPLASVPDTNSVWGFSGDAEFESVAGFRAMGGCKPGSLVTRYLGAFGPATVADFQAWSGLKGAKPLFEGLNLVTFQDDRKRVLYDLPDAPRPDAETPAPIRFIAEFDNLVLGHADRSRIVADEHRPRIVTKNLLVLGTFLVDGFVAGTWKCERKKIRIEPFDAVPPKVMKALEEEGARLARFLEP